MYISKWWPQFILVAATLLVMVPPGSRGARCLTRRAGSCAYLYLPEQSSVPSGFVTVHPNGSVHARSTERNNPYSLLQFVTDTSRHRDRSEKQLYFNIYNQPAGRYICFTRSKGRLRTLKRRPRRCNSTLICRFKERPVLVKEGYEFEYEADEELCDRRALRHRARLALRRRRRRKRVISFCGADEGASLRHRRRRPAQRRRHGGRRGGRKRQRTRHERRRRERRAAPALPRRSNSRRQARQRHRRRRQCQHVFRKVPN